MPVDGENNRTCGACRACCAALEVPALRLPAFTPCPHECERGCGIYASRPACCRDYQCLWLQGHLDDQDRPDRLGVIFTTTAHPTLGTIPLLIECRPGAFARRRVRQAVVRLLRHCPVALSTPDGGQLLTPHTTEQPRITRPTRAAVPRPPTPVRLTVSARPA